MQVELTNNLNLNMYLNIFLKNRFDCENEYSTVEKKHISSYFASGNTAWRVRSCSIKFSSFVTPSQNGRIADVTCRRWTAFAF